MLAPGRTPRLHEPWRCSARAASVVVQRVGEGLCSRYAQGRWVPLRSVYNDHGRSPAVVAPPLDDHHQACPSTTTRHYNAAIPTVHHTTRYLLLRCLASAPVQKARRLSANTRHSTPCNTVPKGQRTGHSLLYGLQSARSVHKQHVYRQRVMYAITTGCTDPK